MKKSLFLVCTGLLFLLFYACRKDKKDQPDPGVEQTTTDVQVVLPAGSTLDLSKTKIFTLADKVSVGADGKANIPFLTGGGQLAFLFDESDNLILTSYITSTQKEISIKSTAQALLFQGLQLIFQPDSAKNAFLERSAGSQKLSSYYTRMEQAFKADHLMLEKRAFRDILIEAIGVVTNENPINIKGKQIHVVDDDVKSKLQIEEEDTENVNILNSAYRRAHAFIYKTAFKNENNLETVIYTTIDYNDAAEKDMKIDKVRFLTNAFDQIGMAQGFKTARTGPVNLPLASNEKEATYKIRILGPGKPVGVPLTDAEKSKLDELYYEYLAYDILAPLLLDVLGYKSTISKINEEALKPFYEKVKVIAQTDPEIMASLKEGFLHTPVRKFFEAVEASNQNASLLGSSLIENMKTGYSESNISFPSAQKLQDYEKQMSKGIELLEYATGVVAGPFILAPHAYYNEMEEFEAKARDNNVKLTPKESSITSFTNQSLTVNPNVEVSGSQTLWYKWKTTGNYGILKISGSEGTTLETDKATINYYSNASSAQLGEDNIDRVVVTAYIKDGTSLIEVGSDTAIVNVKKNQLVMLPDGVTLNSKNGGQNSVKLYLLKADGTKDILPNSAIDYKVVWTTPGTYGTLTNQSTSITTYDDNTIRYTAFDEEARNATENITAKVYFKGKSETAWVLRQEVKGKVKIDNDPKKKVYYTAPRAYHSERNGNGCAVGCGVVVKKDPDAASYSVKVTGIESKLYPTYSDSWSATSTDHIRGYMGYVLREEEAKGNYITGVYGTFTWSGGPGTDHFPVPSCTGTAEVTVTLK